MNSLISTNTQAILLLTAPLITGRTRAVDEDLLSPGEYRRIARQLRNLGRSPSDLLGSDSAELLKELNDIIPADRVGRLLDRGFSISRAIEHWRSRAIWVLSRADSDYPKKIKNRLQEDSPAVLYGCGHPKLLDRGGLAVVGSRHVDQALIDYAEAVGRQCALSKRGIISGGAQGIDRAAMRGALETGGRVVGVLSDSLERAALNRENRTWLLDEQLVLVSPYDPSAGFNVGHAMQRNRVTYALADAALVVSAEFEKGGTWAGATEQLKKMRFVPVYVRSTGEIGRGLQALTAMGARPWPNPNSFDELSRVFDGASTTSANEQPEFSFELPGSDLQAAAIRENHSDVLPSPPSSHPPASDSDAETHGKMSAQDYAESQTNSVRTILIELLATPKTAKEISAALQLSPSQTKSWLQRFLEEGVLEKHTKPKPVRYTAKQLRLL